MLQRFQRKPRSPLDPKGYLTHFMKLQKFPQIPVPTREKLNFPPHVKKSLVFPSSIRDEGRLPCFAWKGMPTSPSHLERRLVSTCHWRGTRGPCHNSKGRYFPIHSRSGLISFYRFECSPRINLQQEGSSDAPVVNPKRTPGPKLYSAQGLKPL